LTQSEEEHERFAQQLAVKEQAIEQLSREAIAGASHVEEVDRRLAEKQSEVVRINFEYGREKKTNLKGSPTH